MAPLGAVSHRFNFFSSSSSSSSSSNNRSNRVVIVFVLIALVLDIFVLTYFQSSFGVTSVQLMFNMRRKNLFTKHCNFLFVPFVIEF